MSDTFSIAVRIADELERQRLVALFDIMAPQLQHHWVVTAPADAAVVIIEGDFPGSQDFLAACKQLAGAVPVLLGHTNPLQAEWFLQRPVRVQTTVALLNHLGQYLQTRQSTPAPVDAPADSGAGTPYGRLRRMFDHLQAQPAYYRFDTAAGWPLYYDSVRDRVLLRQEQARSSQPSQTVQQIVECFAQRQLSAIAVERFKSVSNDPHFALFTRDALIWIWYLNDNSTDQPMSQDGYQLTRWPTLTSLPHTATHLKLCQYMSSHLATQQTIAADTQLPAATVRNFCNACEALGLVTIKAVVQEQNPAQRQRQLGG